MEPIARPELALLGILGCLVVACANGANDIANSVGTSFGAGALTLRQAIVFGAVAEFAGAISLGSFVAKTIAKGVIEPNTFANDGCQGVLTFAVGMFSILAGTGSTTLLATLYGLPISASHGVIGGLVAVGIAAHGVESLGMAPLEATLVAWVASPLLGCLTSGLIHTLIRSTVHETPNPAHRAHALQPVLIAITVTIAAAFLVVAGPDVLRIHPVSLAVGASATLGVSVAIIASCVGGGRRRPSGACSSSRAHFRLEDLAGDSAHDAAAASAGPGANPNSDCSEGSEADPGGPMGVLAGLANLLGCGGGSRRGRRREDDLILRAREGEGPDDTGNVEGGERRGGGGSSGGGGGSGGSSGGDAPHASEEEPFVPLLILSALTVAFAHGGNDLGNSIGPLAAILVAISGGDIAAIPEIPMWVLLLGAGGFVVGILLLGERTITTVGSKITKLTPSRSFAVQMGTAIAVLSSTVLGLAVSTSHCLVGSIIGVGLAAKLRRHDDSELNVAMLTKIVIGWAATIPLAMVVSVTIFEGMMLFYSDDAICRSQG